jgi:hypothetical protein
VLELRCYSIFSRIPGRREALKSFRSTVFDQFDDNFVEDLWYLEPDRLARSFDANISE